MPLPVTPEVIAAKLDGLRDMVTARIDGLSDKLDERFRRVDAQFEQEKIARALLATQLAEYKELAAQWRVPGSAVFVVLAGLVTSLLLNVVNLFWKVSP